MAGNPNAFPANEKNCDGSLYQQHMGMTLRDYFAAQAIPALIARHRADVPWSSIAPRAYGIADAMLEERSKTK